MPEKLRNPHLFTWGLVALMVVQPALGLLFQDVYRDPPLIKVAWFGNDWVTLVLGGPLLIAGLLLAARGSTRGLLLWLGMLGYAIYNYAYYMLGVALNVFLPLYVAALVLAVIVVILALARVDAGAVAAVFGPGTPARIVGGYLVFVGIGLAAVWLVMWGAYVFAGQPTPVEPEAFKLVAALDLAIMVPLLAAGGLLLWQQRAWGYVIAAIAGVQGSLYLLVLSVNSLLAIARGLVEAPGELPIWGALAVLTAAATVLLLAHVGRGTAEAQRTSRERGPQRRKRKGI